MMTSRRCANCGSDYSPKPVLNLDVLRELLRLEDINRELLETLKFISKNLREYSNWEDWANECEDAANNAIAKAEGRGK